MQSLHGSVIHCKQIYTTSGGNLVPHSGAVDTTPTYTCSERQARRLQGSDSPTFECSIFIRHFSALHIAYTLMNFAMDVAQSWLGTVVRV